MDLGKAQELHPKGMRETGTRQHTVIPLVGRFKNEVGEQCHLIPLAATTASGLQPGRWMDRMLRFYDRQGIRHGPVFRTTEGKRAKAAAVEPTIMDVLEEIQEADDGLILGSVVVRKDYGMARSFRRGSDSHAINMKVDSRDIDMNNRWRKFEAAQGRRPRLKMQQHYADVRLILPALLRYSSAL